MEEEYSVRLKIGPSSPKPEEGCPICGASLWALEYIRLDNEGGSFDCWTLYCHRMFKLEKRRVFSPFSFDGYCVPVFDPIADWSPLQLLMLAHPEQGSVSIRPVQMVEGEITVAMWQIMGTDRHLYAPFDIPPGIMDDLPAPSDEDSN